MFETAAAMGRIGRTMALLAVVIGAIGTVELRAQSVPYVLSSHVDVATGQVMISGGNFGVSPQVLYMGYPLQVVFANATAIVLSTPIGVPAGTYLVIVRTSGRDLMIPVTVPATADGTPGPAGPAGPAGPEGPVGPAGSAGPAGAVGPAGPAGSVGATGTAGPSGPAGPIGPAGPAGAAGSAGPVGPAGPMGPTGLQGATGASGAQGPQGPSGPQGLPGGGMTMLGRALLNNGTNPDPVFAYPTGPSTILTAASSQQAVVPVNCTAGSLRVDTDTLTGPRTLTLLQNGVDTALACTVANGGTTCSSANTVSLAAGDLITLKINGGGGGNFNVRYSFVCQ